MVNQLCWALSALGSARAARGEQEGAREVYEMSVQLLLDRVAVGASTPRDERDLPLLLSNLAGFLAESGEMAKALARTAEAVDWERRAIGPDPVSDDLWVLASLLIAFAERACGLGFTGEARAALDEARSLLDRPGSHSPGFLQHERDALARVAALLA